MMSITLKLTHEELKQLTMLAADQLFRKEFIDSRMPGYKPDSAEISRGKQLLERLRLLIAADAGKVAPVPRIVGTNHETAGTSHYKKVPKRL